MITLNDYLYSGDTVLRILKDYSEDLKKNALETHNTIDLAHYNFLLGLEELLEHNDFLASQSQRIREFYKLMAGEYPFLAFTFKGRIKSLIRAEEKFNGYIVSYIYDSYRKNGKFPPESELKARLNQFRDLIAYRIVISMPKCHLREGEDREKTEIRYLYEIANVLPEFLEEHGFSPEIAMMKQPVSGRLKESVRPYYKDYVLNRKDLGYQSLHIAFYDNIARCYIEMQLRTKEMDDLAEIGRANHESYEEMQEKERSRRKLIPEGENRYFDDAYERVTKLQSLDLSKVDVNMFAAIDNSLVNDGCGLYRGRLILPYEHLSRFQNDLVG